MRAKCCDTGTMNPHVQLGCRRYRNQILYFTQTLGTLKVSQQDRQTQQGAGLQGSSALEGSQWGKQGRFREGKKAKGQTQRRKEEDTLESLTSSDRDHLGTDT